MQTSIAAEVLQLCRERGLTLAAAESCTGGLIAKELTDIPGASQVFLGGVVSYTNHVKEQVLRVPAALLERCGAVSAPVARAMALGARVLTGADLALSVTGLAGRTATTGATRWARCSRRWPRRRAFLCASCCWAVTGRRYAPCPPTTRWIWCAAISPIK